MGSTTPYEQTLGGRAEVPPWGAFLGTTIVRCSLPSQLIKGSFRGGFRFSDGASGELPDFALVFQDNKLAGKGEDAKNQYITTGLYNPAHIAEGGEHNNDGDDGNGGGGDGEEPRDSGVRFALTKYYHSPERRTVVSDRYELRCELSPDVTDPHSGRPVGLGLQGKVFAMDGEVFRHGDVALWPTPEDERMGGFLKFVFDSQLCGIEHTGTFAHWTGSGAEVRKVQGPARELGVVPGDVLRLINREPLPLQLRSMQVSALIKGTARPMELVVWRNVQARPARSESGEGLADEPQHPPLQAHAEEGGGDGGEREEADRAAMPPPPHEPVGNAQHQLDSLEQSRRVSMSSEALQSFGSLQNVTQLLRDDMLKQIERKRKSLSQARMRSMERAHSSRES